MKSLCSLSSSGCRNVDQVKKKFEEDSRSTDQLEVLHLDMKSLESVHTFAKTVAGKYPSIHVLVNNAGMFRYYLPVLFLIYVHKILLFFF